MPNEYQHFKLALYCPAWTFLKLAEAQRERDLAFMERHLRLSKVYLESHRGDVSLDVDTLRHLKDFFVARGYETAGGITPTLPSTYAPKSQRLFGAICYSDRASRLKLAQAVQVAATVFDEVILDDFFFTNCSCEDCDKRRGDRSWREFRVELMREISSEVIQTPAKAVNPNVKLVIKYPNWNESYSGTGYDTLGQPPLFDGVYTGTETRDPRIVQQNIPRYGSYALLQWMEAANPGKNGGGWFDALDCSSIDNYLEQAYLTVFGKAREITLYNYDLHCDSVYVPPLGFQLGKLDAVAGNLGRPAGIPAFVPHHARAEVHLADHLGMLGIPLLPTPHFPEPSARACVFLAECAAEDPGILAKLESFLGAGGTVVVSSGFVARLFGKGIERFTSLRPVNGWLDIQRFATDTSCCTFDDFYTASRSISLPSFEFDTNGTWQCIVGFHGDTNVPVVTLDHFRRGKLLTLMTPSNPADLAFLPAGVLSKLRALFGENSPVLLEGPGEVGLFLYDNDTFVLESFAQQPTKWKVRLGIDTQLQSLSATKEQALVPRETDGAHLVKLAPRTFQLFKFVRPGPVGSGA